ncbi:MAG: hypothetical protein ACK452_03475 [Bacteroidota bacterium]|jgi:hypothetical protein
MKKILLVCILFIFSLSVLKTQTNNSGNFRFGLRVAAQPCWLRSNDVKRVKPSGAVFGTGFGLVMDWRINDVASFSTGIGGDFEGGNQDFIDTAYYVFDKDDNIMKFEDVTSVNSNNVSTYMLLSRKLKTTSVTIPLTLKLSTKEIGSVRYFGQFGLNIGWIVKMRSTDQVKSVYVKGVDRLYAEETLEDVNPYYGTIPVRLGLNAGIGGEYRLSGSTSVFCSVNYLHQFINSFVENTKYYANKKDSNNKLTDAAKLSAYGSGVQINLGIMF